MPRGATETTAQAMDMALDVLERLGEKGVTAEQLASVKAYVKGTYPPTRLQTADQLAVILGDLELYGLCRDDVDDFFARIDAVRLEQANAAARKYYKAGSSDFCAVGQCGEDPGGGR